MAILTLVNKSVDIWDEATWPTPWELIQLGGYCENGQALGMFYTLCLIGKPCELQLVQDFKNSLGGTFFAVKVNGFFLTSNGEITKVSESDFNILKKWQVADLNRLVKL